MKAKNTNIQEQYAFAELMYISVRTAQLLMKQKKYTGMSREHAGLKHKI